MARQSLYDYKKEPILAAIKKLSQDGQTPSLREVSEVVELSVSTLHAYLTRLRDEGLVQWTQRNHRSIKVLEYPQPVLAARVPKAVHPVTVGGVPVHVDPDVGF